MSQEAYQTYVTQRQQESFAETGGFEEILSYEQWLQTQPRPQTDVQPSPAIIEDQQIATSTQPIEPQPAEPYEPYPSVPRVITTQTPPSMTQSQYDAAVAQKEAEFNQLPLATKQAELQRLLPTALDVVPKGAIITDITFSGGQLNFSYTQPPAPAPTSVLRPSGGSDNIAPVYNPLEPSGTQKAVAPVPTEFSSMPGGYWNPEGYAASKDVINQIPAGATDIEITEQKFVGPVASGKTYADYPSMIKATYAPPPTPPKEEPPLPTLTQELLNVGQRWPPMGSEIVNPVGSAIKQGFGVKPGSTSLSAGVVAAGEALIYSAPRGFVDAALGFVGGALGKQSEAKTLNDMAQAGMDKVIPRPPPTVSSGVATAVLKGDSSQLGQATKDPVYAVGTVAGDILISLGIGKGVTRITGGNLTHDLTKDLQQPIKQTRLGQNFQDKLNMDYRAASELGEPYRPSFTDKFASKVTGIKAQTPAPGTTVLPTVETVPKEGWETRVNIRASDTEFHMEPRIYEKEPIDSIANMVKGNPSKMQAGMDLMDFADAPRSQVFGLSTAPISPADKAALAARQTTAKAPLPLRFGLGEGYLINAPDTPTFRTSFEQQKLNAELNQKYGASAKEPLSFNKTPYDMGSQMQFGFQKQRLPSTQTLVPSAPETYSPIVNNAQFYRRTPFPITVLANEPVAAYQPTQIQETKPIEKITQATDTRIISGSPISVQQFPIAQQRPVEEQETTIYSYPPSSPFKPPTSPVEDTKLFAPPIDLARSAPTRSERATPIIPIGLGETRTIFNTPEPNQNQQPIGITVDLPIGITGTKPAPVIGIGTGVSPITFSGPKETPITSTIPIQTPSQTTIFDVPTPTKHTQTQIPRTPYMPSPQSNMPKMWHPPGNIAGWGGGGEKEHPFLFAGTRKRRKEYPIVGAEDVLRSFI